MKRTATSAGWRRAATRCWAVASSDTAPVLCAIGAEVTLVSVDGERRIAGARAVSRRRHRIFEQAFERDPDADPRPAAGRPLARRRTASCAGASRSTSRCSAWRPRRGSTPAAWSTRRASSSPAPARGRTRRGRGRAPRRPRARRRRRHRRGRRRRGAPRQAARQHRLRARLAQGDGAPPCDGCARRSRLIRDMMRGHEYPARPQRPQ